MLTKKKTQSFASADEDKSLPAQNSGKITENILPWFSATNSLVCNADLIRRNIYLTPYLHCLEWWTQHINTVGWRYNRNINFTGH